MLSLPLTLLLLKIKNSIFFHPILHLNTPRRASAVWKCLIWRCCLGLRHEGWPNLGSAHHRWICMWKYCGLHTSIPLETQSQHDNPSNTPADIKRFKTQNITSEMFYLIDGAHHAVNPIDPQKAVSQHLIPKHNHSSIKHHCTAILSPKNANVISTQHTEKKKEKQTSFFNLPLTCNLFPRLLPLYPPLVGL